MNAVQRHMMFCVLFVCMLAAGVNAHAEPLPWLPARLSDPLAVEDKAAKLVATDLKPPNCGTASVDRRLYLKDVVIAALCNNPDTRTAYLGLVAEAARHATSYAGYLPAAAASMSRTRTGTFGGDSKATTIANNYGLALGMTLYDFGQREFKLEAAEHALIAAGHTYNATLQGTIAAALQGYYSLLRAQNAVTVARDSERFARESYEAAKLRHKIGQVTLADELQAKGSFSQAILSSQAAQNGLAFQQAALAELLGLPADTSIEVAEVENEVMASDPLGGAVGEWMEQAKRHRRDLLSVREGVRASEQSLAALKRANLATLSATASMSVNNDRVDVFSRTAPRSQAIGLSVSIPIFSGFSQTYNERAAEKSLEAQRVALASNERGVELDVWNAWHNYETAKRSWETSKDQMASAELLKDVALGRYKEGLGTILDVLNAQQQYSSALQSQLTTRHNLLTARVDLIRAAGLLNLATMQPDSAMRDPGGAN